MAATSLLSFETESFKVTMPEVMEEWRGFTETECRTKAFVHYEDEVSKMRSRQQKLAFARKLMTCESRDERREEEEEDENDDVHRMEDICEIPLSVPDIISQSSPSSSSPSSSAAEALLITPPSTSRDVSAAAAADVASGVSAAAAAVASGDAVLTASGISLGEVSLTEDSSIGSPPLATPPSATPVADATLSFWSTHTDTPTMDSPDVGDYRTGGDGPYDTFRAALMKMVTGA